MKSIDFWLENKTIAYSQLNKAILLFLLLEWPAQNIFEIFVYNFVSDMFILLKHIQTL